MSWNSKEPPSQYACSSPAAHMGRHRRSRAGHSQCHFPSSGSGLHSPAQNVCQGPPVGEGFGGETSLVGLIQASSIHRRLPAGVLPCMQQSRGLSCNVQPRSLPIVRLRVHSLLYLCNQRNWLQALASADYACAGICSHEEAPPWGDPQHRALLQRHFCMRHSRALARGRAGMPMPVWMALAQAAASRPLAGSTPLPCISVGSQA